MEVIEFVQKTESTRGAKPFLIAREGARKKAEQDEMLARVRSGDRMSNYSGSLAGTRDLTMEHTSVLGGATEGRITWARSQTMGGFGGTVGSAGGGH